MSYDVDFDMPEPTGLLLAGDWHGVYSWTEKIIDYAKAEGIDTIVQLGDFGYWPQPNGGCNYLNRVTKKLRQEGICLYWLDGNHENHSRLEPGMGHDGVIRHLPRGHRWEWFGKTWMAVGGAPSVDKDMRVPGVEWFSDEVLSYIQFEHCTRDGHVDVIVAHDAPEGARIPGLDDPMWSREALERSRDHRELMLKIATTTGATEWFHGHYHRHYQSELGPLVITGLDMNNTSIERNTYRYVP